ncbi:GNAT family N-acetyltransferase [Chitinophaga solisilvae]|uniref:GNAT family N-acetyltransferase n=1 Tax=Chitinophaga solisilvae TaxID=1233460 RepID=UPI001368F47D|nr:GNAT family N-acetyltransferase [Chitinophaga solisilvae]
MSSPYHADPLLVATWVKGWAISREVAPPVSVYDGSHVTVGWPAQLARYVFPHLSDGYKALAATIHEPFIHLKVLDDPEEARAWLPSRWVIQEPGHMMVCPVPMTGVAPVLPDGYTVDIQDEITVPLVRILAADGTTAAAGRIALVDDYIIYDRIETHPDHRRRGLATLVMYTLQQTGFAKGGSKGILVATAAGRALYTTLGWKFYAPLTTAIIPGE